MSIFQSSFLGSLLISLYHAVVNAYEKSLLCGFMDRVFAWFTTKWNQSIIVHWFYDESRLSKAFPDSLICRGIDWLLNLPLRLLQWIYRLLKRPLDGSLFAGLAFSMGKEAHLAAGWFIAIILSIPYSMWNNAYSLIFFTLVLVLLFLGGMDEGKRRFSVRDMGPYFLFYFGAAILSVILSAYTDLSFRYLPYHLSCMIAVIAMVNAVTKGEHLLRLAGGLGLGILSAAGYGLYQWFVIGVEVNPVFVDLSVNEGMPGRVYSFFENPNALGELLMLSLPILVALMFSARRWYSRLAAAFVFGVGAMCLGLTLSRGSWVGLAVAAFVYVFLWNRKLIPLGIAAVLVILPFLPDFIINRLLTITNMQDSSINSRFPQYKAAIRTILDRPVLGAGLGADAVRQYVGAHGFYQGDSPFVHAHNTFLQIWVETGLLGLLSFLGTVIWGVKETARSIRTTEDAAAKHIAIGGVSALMGAMACGFADYIFTYPRIMFVFWFVVGLTFAAIRCCKAEANRV